MNKWIIIKRLPRAIKIYFKMRKLDGHKLAIGYFKLALAWS